ncbi:MAG: NADH-quinone oxidoreductase subunit J [Proteobacteria bacterium]|nr:NADH-quinone oxidoreductase subunit J [Pseudomonadota bacterium]MBU2228260.1 NADH-quinone oxidoreductase subunit J [Pseudomonadota bacterium]MBU2260684.1 NADH-quinone oxidoreductase subunit J [Pseudomonadota bacterium]
MNFAEIIFLFIIAVTMGGAATAVLAGSVVYAIMGLVVTMFGVAALYVYLNSPFVALMQILIYVGAVTVLIAFAVMLVGPLYRRPKEWTTAGKFGAALGVALVSLLLFVRFVTETFPRAGAPSFEMTTKDIGRLFFDDLVLPFELISLLIVVAILGAIMLALFARGNK